MNSKLTFLINILMLINLRTIHAQTLLHQTSATRPILFFANSNLDTLYGLEYDDTYQTILYEQYLKDENDKTVNKPKWNLHNYTINFNQNDSCIIESLIEPISYQDTNKLIPILENGYSEIDLMIDNYPLDYSLELNRTNHLIDMSSFDDFLKKDEQVLRIIKSSNSDVYLAVVLDTVENKTEFTNDIAKQYREYDILETNFRIDLFKIKDDDVEILHSTKSKLGFGLFKFSVFQTNENFFQIIISELRPSPIDHKGYIDIYLYHFTN